MSKFRPIIGKRKPCLHGMEDYPDEKEMNAMTITANEIMEKWPKFSGTCKKCGFSGSAYAHFAHFMADNW